MTKRALLENEIDDHDAAVRLEKFYVYRSLHSDESWGAVLVGGEKPLPNCDFLMKVFALNETEAIGRARRLYDKIHKHDTDKANMKYFMGQALGVVSKNIDYGHDNYDIVGETVNLASALNNALKEFLNKEKI